MLRSGTRAAVSVWVGEYTVHFAENIFEPPAPGSQGHPTPLLAAKCEEILRGCRVALGSWRRALLCTIEQSTQLLIPYLDLRCASCTPSLEPPNLQSDSRISPAGSPSANEAHRNSPRHAPSHGTLCSCPGAHSCSKRCVGAGTIALPLRSVRRMSRSTRPRSRRILLASLEASQRRAMPMR